MFPVSMLHLSKGSDSCWGDISLLIRFYSSDSDASHVPSISNSSNDNYCTRWQRYTVSAMWFGYLRRFRVWWRRHAPAPFVWPPWVPVKPGTDCHGIQLAGIVFSIIALQCDILALVWLFGPANVTFWTCQCDFSALRLFPASGTLPHEFKKYVEMDYRLKETIKINYNDANDRRNTQTQEPWCFPCIRYI